MIFQNLFIFKNLHKHTFSLEKPSEYKKAERDCHSTQTGSERIEKNGLKEKRKERFRLIFQISIYTSMYENKKNYLQEKETGRFSHK